jgi:recombination protein RecT
MFDPLSTTLIKNFGPWATDYAEMGRKTVVRRLSKYIPKSPELSHALEIEDRAEGFGDYIDVPFENLDPNSQATEGEEEGQKTDKLKEQLRARQGKSTGEQASTATTTATEPSSEPQANLGV